MSRIVWAPAQDAWMAEHGFMSTALSSLSPSAVALPASSLSTTSTETSSTIGCPTCKSFPEVSTPGTTTTSFGNSERKCAACGLNCGKPALLDLFSGAGGAARGYQQAGFCVLGVDLAPQPHYIGCEFVQADAMTFPLDGFDAIHASPPCQGYSRMRHLPWLKGKDYPLLIEPVRERLVEWGGPWVIENVEDSPLLRAPGLFGIHGTVLCGTMFGLGVYRHRPFESSVVLGQPEHPRHREVILEGPHLRSRCRLPVRRGITAWQEDGGCGGHMGNVERVRQAMGIDWMPADALSQAIPPAYTTYLGQFLLAAVG